MTAPIGTPFKVKADQLVGPGMVNFSLGDIDFPSAVSQYTVQVQVGEAFTGGNVTVNVTGGLDQVSYPGFLMAPVVTSTAPVSMFTMGQTYQNLRVTVSNTDTINHTVTVWLLAK